MLTIKKCCLKWLGHVLQKLPEYLPCQILLVEPISYWKKHQGGQRKNWWNLAKSDLEPIRVSENSVTDGQHSGLLLQSSWHKIEQYGPKRSLRSLMLGEMEMPDSHHKYKYHLMPFLCSL